MAQPSVANYFHTRKRTAVEDHKINHARKVLVLDSGNVFKNGDDGVEIPPQSEVLPSKLKETIVNKIATQNMAPSKRVVKPTKSRKIKQVRNQQNIDQMIDGMNSKIESCVTPPNEQHPNLTKPNKELENIKRKLTRSSRLAELKASINRFNESARNLKEAEKKTISISESPKLKTFKTIELEVEISPQKVQSPEKAYLSPKKDTNVRKNLLNLLSPTKNSVPTLPESVSKKIFEATAKPALTLPFKYRYLAEIFRGIDTIVQMLYNRKEVITFKKLKPAVEEILKRNISLTHIGQIKSIFPEAFNYHQEKIRAFGCGLKQEQWELVFTPCIEENGRFSSDFLLVRRRKLFNILLNKVKDYHDEFLQTLEPPLIIPKEKVTRWHPEFDIEKVPDIDAADMPQPPVEEKLTTGQEVLEKARQLFSCNTRMEQALERLKKAKETNSMNGKDKPPEPTSILKGIPKALLEKVRQRQAAKALLSMTRSEDKEKEIQLYSRLPELARFARNLFVTEKKSVLPLDTVVEKLGNSYRCFLTKTEMEDHLKVIAKECTGWMVFHNVRNCVYLKLSKNADLSLVINKLENLAKQKDDSL